MSGDLLNRLESVTSRLESLVSNISSTGISTSHTNGVSTTSNTNTSTNVKLQSYDKFYSEFVQPFVKVASSIKGLENISKYADIAFTTQRNIIDATIRCKKPTDSELLNFINPIVQVIENSTKNVDRKSSLFNQQQSWAESVQSFQWIMTTTPKQTITDALEASDFYLVKILTEAKKNNDNANTEYAKQLKLVLQNLATYTFENYRAGLEWNPQGISITQYKSGSSASSNATPSSAPAPPPPPAGNYSTAPLAAPPSTSPSGSSGASGMGAVFGELTGTGGSFKLNKVTDDMKAKNRKNEPSLEAKQPTKPTTTKTTATPSKAPSTNLVKGTWFVENYSGGENVIVKDVQLKENVFISNCNNVNVTIPDKTKSITVNSCKRVYVTFKSVVSIFEVVNSQNIKIECIDTIPSIQLDKSSGIQIFLSKAGVAEVPNIITSNVSEINLVVPGKSEEDDPIELPLPEQYISKYENGKVVTEAVSHSGSS